MCWVLHKQNWPLVLITRKLPVLKLPKGIISSLLVGRDGPVQGLCVLLSGPRRRWKIVNFFRTCQVHHPHQKSKQFKIIKVDGFDNQSESKESAQKPSFPHDQKDPFPELTGLLAFFLTGDRWRKFGLDSVKSKREKALVVFLIIWINLHASQLILGDVKLMTVENL